MLPSERACSTMAMSMTRLLTAPATRPTTLLAVVDDPTSTSTCGSRRSDGNKTVIHQAQPCHGAVSSIPRSISAT